jgi:ATP-dependent exoDNAse (exonuclease V) alpha subunit
MNSLTLNPGMPIMLIRNLRDDLCNGTRLIVKRVVNNRLLIANIAGTDVEVAIPRVKLEPINDGTFPFRWSRRQFPVVVAFAISVNKSQGQTMDCVGVYNLDPAFTHGQCYVSASRVGSPDCIRFLCTYDPKTFQFVTRNVVYKEALQ